ncbi:hypothetical protein ATEIFO6365_0007012500 [Aspergillus terreus]|uniref:Uncharacterized protein n=1 Tax=Aspergillus terreus TaxID=33178 RepID=A0A5M3Z5D8_ASPTE|nr:hypothetical protein ATETN484_0009012500 [Aspergillus terreus]GFF17576.1 hypothetical protein ATEIFO6365_0007012500 [Aspergillus terreus]
MGVKETTFILPITTTELSYASGNLPGTTNTRFNRTARSTADEDMISIKDGFINKALQAGGRHVCEMSCTSITPVPGQGKAHDNFLRNGALLDKITKMVPDFHGLHFLGRVPALEPHKAPRWTLVIVARRPSKHCNWVDAARKISALLNGNGIHDVAVEIVDVRYMMRPQDFDLLPCRHDDVISSVWDAVVDSIFGAIGTEGVHAIGCYRIRTPFTKGKQDMPVTVVVDVDQRARRSWKPVRDAIISVLEQWTLCHVGVLIRQDTKTKDVNVGWKQFVPVRKSLQTRSVARIGRLAGSLGLVRG